MADYCRRRLRVVQLSDINQAVHGVAVDPVPLKQKHITVALVIAERLRSACDCLTVNASYLIAHGRVEVVVRLTRAGWGNRWPRLFKGLRANFEISVVVDVSVVFGGH
ncbi:hypothetical protein D3C87_1695160 [compost metagenome]